MPLAFFIGEDGRKLEKLRCNRNFLLPAVVSMIDLPLRLRDNSLFPRSLWRAAIVRDNSRRQ